MQQDRCSDSSLMPGSRAIGASEVSEDVPKVQCIMSYGLAAGPVTAGVLGGRNPVRGPLWNIILLSRLLAEVLNKPPPVFKHF